MPAPREGQQHRHAATILLVSRTVRGYKVPLLELDRQEDVRRRRNREHQVLSLIAEGLSNAEIAERLSLSEKTVRNHVSNLFDKLGVWTRAQAIVFARDRGFKGAARS